ncbi:YbaB/EbfC family nucleoid-associated protein [Temperatibacter marinus]|uniref:Nucleoid-associated protein QGN29_03135 n=1 Tax=Temperatibacter marinus TaxID=1456591 RepID=A0AA52EIY1_9PROT|nr:YbaB/EbfC family nucleoid-associated protein [Temperatibacter marinus]WND03364.1 YbaB/EbfC family nucleoid-associated protein [Temperatibacter marinus]
MKNLSGMLKKAQEMQEKMQSMQAEMENQSVEGSSGAGLVNVTLNGKGEMKALSIDPSLFTAEEKEVVEDLILAAHADARSKVEAMQADNMKDLTGGIPMPDGFKMPF